MDRKKSHINQNNEEPIKYRRQYSNTFITWNIWYNNLLFSKCENYNAIITPKYTNPPNLSTILL